MSSGLPVILSAQLPISYSANNVNFPGEAAFPSQSTGKNQEAASLVSKDEPKTRDPREIHVTQASSVGLHPRTQMGKGGDSLMTGFVQKVRESPQARGVKTAQPRAWLTDTGSLSPDDAVE